ncbi:MAG: hypothetical protein ABSG41_26065 [Bryobacteraceae bacterium]|jgi:hypothetical protein
MPEPLTLDSFVAQQGGAQPELNIDSFLARQGAQSVTAARPQEDQPNGYGALKLAPEPTPTAQDRFTRTPIAFGQTYNAPDPQSANTSYSVDPKFTARMYGQGPASLIEANMGPDPVANSRMLRHESMHALLSTSTADYNRVLSDPVLKAASKPVINIMKANGYRGDADDLAHELPAYLGAFTTSGVDPATKLPAEWTSGVTPSMRNNYVAAFARALAKQDPQTAAKYQRMLADSSPGTPASKVDLLPSQRPQLPSETLATPDQAVAGATILARALVAPPALPAPTPGMTYAPPSYQIQQPPPPPSGPLIMSTARTTLPKSYTTEPTTREILQTPIIKPEDIDEAFPFLVGPFRIHAGVLKAVAGMTSPENAAIAAGTAGLGAVPGLTAKIASTGLSVYFATQAGKALAEKYPQLKAAVKAKDWQSVLELGGAGVADAAMFYGAGKHALGNALGIPADIAASLLSQIILYNAGPCRE